MADTIIDRLFIAFGINADGVQKGMTKAENIIHKGIDSIKSVIMPLATGFALTSMVQGFVEGATQVAKTSERLGMSMEDLQAWQGAVQALGAESSVAGEMLGVLNEKLVDAVKMGGTGSLELFKKLGISIKDNAGNMRAASDVLLDLAGSSERLSKQELYGYSKALGLSPEMIDLLVQGRKGLEDLLSAQKELAVFQKEDVEIAQKGRIAWQGFMKSLQAIQAVIMRAVLPVLTILTEGLTKMVIFIRENQPFIIALVTGFAIAIATTLIPAVLSMAAAGWAAIAPWLPFIAVITAAALVVDDFWTYLEGGESALAPVWDAFKKFFSFFETSVNGVKKYWQNACEFFSAVFSGEWAKAGQSLLGMFEGVFQFVFGLFEGFGAYFSDLINTITGGAVDAFMQKIDGVLDYAKNAWGKVKSFFGFGEEEKQNTNPKSPFENFDPNHNKKLSVSNGEFILTTTKPQEVKNNNTITSSTSVGTITINTQAADAAGIAKAISPALKNEFDSSSLVMAANTGVIAK